MGRNTGKHYIVRIIPMLEREMETVSPTLFKLGDLIP
jgi:hypothetical protein